MCNVLQIVARFGMIFMSREYLHGFFFGKLQRHLHTHLYHKRQHGKLLQEQLSTWCHWSLKNTPLSYNHSKVARIVTGLTCYANADRCIVCPFVPFPLAIVLSVLRFTDSDYTFGIFDLFLKPYRVE
jgi:hypothetical protein